MKRNTTCAQEAFLEANRVIPGGVNSPVRAFTSVGTTPVFVSRGQGARVWDIDGNEYIDYIGSWGPLILGHAHPKVVESIQMEAIRGTSFGLSTQIETKMAVQICNSLPSVEMVRMVNSGTEAAMTAIRLARGYTKRQKIVKFQGNYHGHADALLIKSGSGVATLGLPDSPGVPDNVTMNTITIPYNSLESIQLAFERYGEQIAAVMVEPVAGNMGVVPPLPGFLQELREITAKYGSLLIFDEVMTGFRVSYQGAQGLYGIEPDLTCLGKVIGGGLPVGAYGGKREIMEQIAPVGPIYQAGTLSGNPLAMSAGYRTLRLLEEPGIYEELDRKTAKLAEGFMQNARRIGVPLKVNRVGSMLSPYFTEQDVVNYETAQRSNMHRFKKYHAAMLDLGILTAPTPYEVMFVSTAHSDEDIENTIEAHYQALNTIKKESGD
ncbi:glutamate-1-semialdehyde 2,1-aminomutase [Paenibacillus farraposensis]|uniref:Glutamate-1-semialdehyde 2,1-aminomutase n=1 Tax=Paenibacillus farraposensis TaxID=2807095 RepID=A0ABW4DAY9_9BACL|nr:glutamate-1-semialdehyde 2,1-aminomutase [Paenibacillus farraposensis]MCC3381541.1 glutamate-1-semialdehyde 2,1-aminomutase [Paenibacillus farraposensis]